MLPSQLSVNGVDFALGQAQTGKPDAVVAKGQAIDLPAGDFNRVYVLAASAEQDQEAVFRAGSHSEKADRGRVGGLIGQWDTRVWKPRPDTVTEGGEQGDSEPAHQVPLRKGWAVSANHATWDITTLDRRTGPLAIPTTISACAQVISSRRHWRGMPRITIRPMA